jgi:hypothetical protein
MAERRFYRAEIVEPDRSTAHSIIGVARAGVSPALLVAGLIAKYLIGNALLTITTSGWGSGAADGTG